MIPLSILDLAFITEGSSATEALHRSADLAQHEESLGFKRFWLAEHHSMAGIASAATAVVIGYVVGATKTIRAGSILGLDGRPVPIRPQCARCVVIRPPLIWPLLWGCHLHSPAISLLI
ncbi:LLM class flavin-dependent oxidoreductase [Gluconobacter albidus]|nr:LLM class flavin-dependent oxidoreductase [Gluconobacter albidus]